ncbi:MAG: hypothetical protein RL307_11 [Pseudomonadota bacterium]|jgi:5-(carboxyamino)imidazole ribonucleotide synthase
MSTQSQLALQPGDALGVLGGGQLGRMMAHAAQAMGLEVIVLDPDANGPAAQVAQGLVQTAYDDPAGWMQLAQQVQAVTTEFENVPAQALQALAELKPVSPGAHSVAIAQDRAAEKAHFKACGVPVAPHAVLHSINDVAQIDDALFPGILKTTRLGYDGKGQVRVPKRSDFNAAWQSLQKPGAPPVTCVLEAQLPLDWECSVLVARSHDGHCVSLPPQRNWHRDGILAVTEVGDDAVPIDMGQALTQAALAVAQGLAHVGVLCVEFFVLQPGPWQNRLGHWVVNEIAPRPHNSGHHSIDSCDVSQFELQVRCAAHWPLVTPRLHSPAVMLNLLGDVWQSTSGQTREPIWREPNWSRVLALPGAHLHLYGKSEPRVGRKMGHLTFTASSLQAARTQALCAAEVLGIAPW